MTPTPPHNAFPHFPLFFFSFTSYDFLNLKVKGKAMMPSETHVLLTVSEVARALRVDDTTVRRWIKQGALEAILLPHLGKRKGYRVRKDTFDQLFASTASNI